jgi:hypothetical protein
MEHIFHIQIKNKIFDDDWLKRFATEILNAKYKKTDVAEVMKGLTHLYAHQKADLLWVLYKNKKMFDETLDVYSHEKTFKGRQQSMLDQHLMSTEQSQKM